MIKKWLSKLLFDWVFVLLYKLFRALLTLVEFVEGIFDVFAGVAKVSYFKDGIEQRDYLVNVFFGQNIIAVIFWGMTAISLVLCFVFTIVAVTRKILDIGGGVKQSLGQILNGALRSCVSFLFVSVVCIASVNLANICLVQINYLMKNASTLMYDSDNTKTFTGEENAAMTRIMNTIANYSLNSSTENRYNINVCFNSIREDLLYLQQHQFFSYEYPMEGGHHNWQSAITLIANSADISRDLDLETTDSSVTEAIRTVMNEIKYNPDFRPLESASRPEQGESSVASTIFLVSSMEAPNSSVYRDNPTFDDALRRSYLNGTKSWKDMSAVRKDFDIWEMRYDVGYITCLVFIVIMTQCTFLFILRLFDLLLLYIAAPAFASTIPLDDGVRFQTWRQAFTIKVISGFGSIMAMRLYLVLIQIIMDGKLRFFEDNATNYLCQLLFILAGSYAVLKASPLLTQIVAGNSMAAANSEALSAALGGMVGAKLVQATGLGLRASAALAQAPGAMFRGAGRIRQRRTSAYEAGRMSNESLGIGKASGNEGGSAGGGLGNLAILPAPQNRLGGGVSGSGAGSTIVASGSGVGSSIAMSGFGAGGSVGASGSGNTGGGGLAGLAGSSGDGNGFMESMGARGLAGFGETAGADAGISGIMDSSAGSGLGNSVVDGSAITAGSGGIGGGGAGGFGGSDGGGNEFTGSVGARGLSGNGGTESGDFGSGGGAAGGSGAAGAVSGTGNSTGSGLAGTVSRTGSGAAGTVSRTGSGVAGTVSSTGSGVAGTVSGTGSGIVGTGSRAYQASLPPTPQGRPPQRRNPAPRVIRNSRQSGSPRYTGRKR